MTQCDSCAYLQYDEETEEYICDMDMDEDDYERLCSNSRSDCPYWQNGDEYAVVRKQA